MTLFRILTLIALVAAAANANATLVSVTGNFSRLTLGGFYPPPSSGPDSTGLVVNGQSIPICGADPSCTALLNDPSQATVALNGSTVVFGYEPGNFGMNEFSFTGNTTEVVGVGSGNQFKLGTITFANGGFYPLSFLDFALTTHSTNPVFDNQTFAGRIRLDVNISPPQTPEQNADYFTILNSSGSLLTNLGSVRVYEAEGAGIFCPVDFPVGVPCDVGSADLYGYIGSLHLDHFANPTGGAFLNSSTTTVLTPNTPVPEPSALMLGVLGLALLGGTSRRRRVADSVLRRSPVPRSRSGLVQPIS